MKRKVGDKVRIKRTGRIITYYNHDVQQYLGKEAIILLKSHIREIYKLDIDDGKYNWIDEMLEDIEEETQDAQNPNDILESLARKITPQSLESNDGRFSIKVSDAEFLELTMTMLKADEDGYMQEDTDSVRKLEFHISDLDRLIEILQAAKQIETRCWDTIIEQFR